MDSSVGLIAEARERTSKPLSSRERWVAGVSALVFVAASAAAWVTVPAEPVDPLLVGVLVALYAAVSRVEFEVGAIYTIPEQLVFVPMLFLVPLPLVPLMVAAGFLLAELPDYVQGRTRADRSLWCLNDALFSFGPVLVLAAFAPTAAPDLSHTGLYAAAFAAQVMAGGAVIVVRQAAGNGVPLADALRSAVWSYRIDAILSPIGLMVAIQAAEHPVAIAATIPLVWLLAVFSQERKQRHEASLELNQAYRGTVMLLSDVVEADDQYTGDHCRSVVELVTEVANDLRIPHRERQELEFAALLHDVGKIAIPKEILNKPAKLTDQEFELVKRHTLEGQLLLDRVGGLLGRVGEIVRSCHERWDGNGYPDGLVGEQIPLAARIVFCCDAYNAMTTDRPYRKAMPREEAIAELRANSGTQFDPTVVTAVERVVTERVQYPYLAHVSADAVAATLAGAHAQPHAAAG